MKMNYWPKKLKIMTILSPEEKAINANIHSTVV